VASAKSSTQASDRPDQEALVNGRSEAAFVINEAFGFLIPAALRAVASVCVADHLVDGPRTPSELAALTGTHAQSLYRILRLLSTRGFFQEDAEGRFALTALGHALRTDAPFSARHAVLWLTDRTVWEPCGDLAYCLMHGSSAFSTHFGMPIFDYFERDEATATAFHVGMASMSDPENEPVAQCLDIPGSATVVDVGGGYGGLLLEVLRARPDARGILYEHAHALSGHILDTPVTTGRWELAEGDFFAEVPPGDVYVLKRILDTWSDNQCVRILSNCRRRLSPGGHILIVDAVIPSGNAPHQAKSMDVLVMASYVGQERTEVEFSQLFVRAGLRIVSITSTPTVLSVIKVVPANVFASRILNQSPR
jgi:O-methyltransferase domain